MPTIAAAVRRPRQPWENAFIMTLLLLEALLAGLILVGIVWWTMFSGRRKGELPGADPAAKDPDKDRQP